MGTESGSTITSACLESGAAVSNPTLHAERTVREPPSRFGGMALCAVSVITPPLIAIAIQVSEILSADSESRWGAAHSLGVLSAVFVGFYIGLRRGRLLDLMLGIPIGAAAGFVDLRSLEWIVRSTDISIVRVAYFPVWGILIGMWAALSRRRMMTMVAVVAVVALLDFLARAVWFAVADHVSLGDLFHHRPLDSWNWVVGSLTYSVPSFAAVLLARRSRESPFARHFLHKTR